MDSDARPSNVERVQLPSIQNLVDTLPPNAYRPPSVQSTWNSPFHHAGTDSTNNNGPQRNRLQSLTPALQTPPPRHHRVESPQTVTASPSVIISSASSGVSDDYVRPPASSTALGLSVSSAPIRTTPQDPRTSSPISSGLAPFSHGAYRSIRPSHSFVSQIPSSQPPQQPHQPHGANLESRLPVHSTGGRPSPTSTTAAIGSRLNTTPTIYRDYGGSHHQQSDQDSRRVPHPSDRQSGQPLRTFSPPHSTSLHHHDHHFITPSSERFLPPRNGPEYMPRQREENDRNRSRSQSQADHFPPPTPPWDSHGTPVTYLPSSVRELDPGDARSRPGQHPFYAQYSNESPVSTTPSVAYRSRGSKEQSSYASKESRARDDHHSEPPASQGFGLRPARWVESDAFHRSEKTDTRRSEDTHRQSGLPEEEEHGVLATRTDRRYPPILPAPSYTQRQVSGADEPRGRHGSITVKGSRYGADAALGMTRPFAPKHAAQTGHSATFMPNYGPKPPLPNGLIRHKSKEDLGRVLHELTNEANRAVAEGKAMKKIYEFARAIQQFAAYNARYPGPPVASAEDLKEMSHRAVLVYRMAQAIKERSDAKRAAASNPPPALLSVQSRTQKKKPITKEEKQVMEDMERIRRKRTSAQQGIKSKYVKRNKKTIAPKQCASCHTKETPEWRKGPDGPRSLCNACGLHWAKLQRKRKEDGQWVGQGAPPPIDIITLRQVTGVGLQPRFNERGEFEIPGTYSNIPASRAVFSSLHMRKSPPTASTSASNEAGPPNIVSQSPIPAPPSIPSSEDNHIAIDKLTVEDRGLSTPSPPRSQPATSPIFPDAPEGRAKKRKSSRDHGASNTDDDERPTASFKRRHATSPKQGDGTQPPTPADEVIWRRAF